MTPEQKRTYNRAYYHRHREALRLQQKGYYARVQRRAHYKRRYGIALEAVEAMFEKQHGRCAACGTTPADRPLQLDHDHITGEVRGLLCRPCNTALGLLRDSPAKLQGLITYLTQRLGETTCQMI